MNINTNELPELVDKYFEKEGFSNGDFWLPDELKQLIINFIKSLEQKR